MRAALRFLSASIALTAAGFTGGYVVGARNQEKPSDSGRCAGALPSADEESRRNSSDDVRAADDGSVTIGARRKIAPTLPRRTVIRSSDPGSASRALAAFLGGLHVAATEGGQGSATFRGVELHWRTSEAGEHEELLTVVAMPVGVSDSDDWPSALIEALVRWEFVNGNVEAVASRLVEGATSAVAGPFGSSRVVAAQVRSELEELGLVASQEQVLEGIDVLIGRTRSDGKLVWSVWWDASRMGVRYHPDPFEAAREQQLLDAILRGLFGSDERGR